MIFYTFIIITISVIVAYKVNQGDNEGDSDLYLDNYYKIKDLFVGKEPYYEIKSSKEFNIADGSITFFGFILLIFSLVLFYKVNTIITDIPDLWDGAERIKRDLFTNAIVGLIYGGFCFTIAIILIYIFGFKKMKHPILIFTEKGLIYNNIGKRKILRTDSTLWKDIISVNLLDWDYIELEYTKENKTRYKEEISYSRIGCSRDELIELFKQYNIKIIHKRP